MGLSQLSRILCCVGTRTEDVPDVQAPKVSLAEVQNQLYLDNSKSIVQAATFAGDGACRSSATSATSSALQLKLKVPFSELTFHALIGKGSFKQVYRGKWNNTNVAIVAMRRGGLVTEARLMQQLGAHPNLVQFYRWSTDLRGNEYVVVELVPFGSLDKVLAQFGASLRNRAKLMMCEQICHAMCELAAEGVLHRDLAARNILVQSMQPVHVKVSDFGLARAASRRDLKRPAGDQPLRGGTDDGTDDGGVGDCSPPLGADSCNGPAQQQQSARQGEGVSGGSSLVPVRWSAPEVLRTGSGWSEKSDVYSYGITMWEIFSNGAEPYANRSNVEAAAAIVGGELLQQPKDCPHQVYALMRDCWHPESAQRPTFRQIAAVFRRWREMTLAAKAASAGGASAHAASGNGAAPALSPSLTGYHGLGIGRPRAGPPDVPVGGVGAAGGALPARGVPGSATSLGWPPRALAKPPPAGVVHAEKATAAPNEAGEASVNEQSCRLSLYPEGGESTGSEANGGGGGYLPVASLLRAQAPAPFSADSGGAAGQCPTVLRAIPSGEIVQLTRQEDAAACTVATGSLPREKRGSRCQPRPAAVVTVDVQTGARPHDSASSAPYETRCSGDVSDPSRPPGCLSTSAGAASAPGCSAPCGSQRRLTQTGGPVVERFLQRCAAIASAPEAAQPGAAMEGDVAAIAAAAVADAEGPMSAPACGQGRPGLATSKRANSGNCPQALHDPQRLPKTRAQEDSTTRDVGGSCGGSGRVLRVVGLGTDLAAPPLQQQFSELHYQQQQFSELHNQQQQFSELHNQQQQFSELHNQQQQQQPPLLEEPGLWRELLAGHRPQGWDMLQRRGLAGPGRGHRAPSGLGHKPRVLAAAAAVAKRNVAGDSSAPHHAPTAFMSDGSSAGGSGSHGSSGGGSGVSGGDSRPKDICRLAAAVGAVVRATTAATSDTGAEEPSGPGQRQGTLARHHYDSEDDGGPGRLLRLAMDLPTKVVGSPRGSGTGAGNTVSAVTAAATAAVMNSRQHIGSTSAVDSVRNARQGPRCYGGASASSGGGGGWSGLAAAAAAAGGSGGPCMCCSSAAALAFHWASLNSGAAPGYGLCGACACMLSMEVETAIEPLLSCSTALSTHTTNRGMAAAGASRDGGGGGGSSLPAALASQVSQVSSLRPGAAAALLAARVAQRRLSGLDRMPESDGEGTERALESGLDSLQASIAVAPHDSSRGQDSPAVIPQPGCTPISPFHVPGVSTMAPLSKLMSEPSTPAANADDAPPARPPAQPAAATRQEVLASVLPASPLRLDAAGPVAAAASDSVLRQQLAFFTSAGAAVCGPTVANSPYMSIRMP